MGMETVSDSVEARWQFIKKLSVDLSSYDPAAPLLGIYIYPREWKLCPHQTCTLVFISTLYMIVEKLKTNVYKLVSG